MQTMAAPATRGSGGDKGGDGWEAVRALTDNPALHLSTEDRLTKHFHALVRIAFKTREGTRGTSYLVQRDDERAAVLILSDQGLPFCYMTDGFLAIFNPDKAGQLLVYEGGSPSFTLASDREDGTASCELTFDSKAESARVTLDIAAILRACLKKARAVTLEASNGEIELKTERSLVSIEQAPQHNPHGFPLTGITIVGTAGDSVAAGPIGLDSQPAARLFGIDRRAVEQLDINCRQLSAEDAARLEVIVPPRFGRDAREKAAAERFMKLYAR
jgi:hypothetical protein